MANKDNLDVIEVNSWAGSFFHKRGEFIFNAQDA